ncbi:MAG: hypothetical protein F6K16_42970 [Symploca sp. SIO2B6]|nr:hypothetical protein [Symploca sp. SIO2B6]
MQPGALAHKRFILARFEVDEWGNRRSPQCIDTLFPNKRHKRLPSIS